MAITFARAEATTSMSNKCGMSASINIADVTVTGNTFDLPALSGTITNWVNNAYYYPQTSYHKDSYFRGFYYIDGVKATSITSYDFEFKNTAYLSLSEATGWTSKAWTANATHNSTLTALNTSDFFNSSNPTTKVLPITLQRNRFGMLLADLGDSVYSTATAMGTGTANLVLNVPPTATVSAMSFDTGYVYAGLTTASVTVSGATAHYGGTITSSTLIIGNQTATISDNGTLSILLDTVGSFTPTITITDSRGQTKIYSLSPITVNGYVAPSVNNISIERTNTSGVADDEGVCAVITVNMNWAYAIADLTAPTVVVKDLDGVTQTSTTTWYTTRSSSGVSGAISDWSQVVLADMPIYGLVDNAGHNLFNTQYSYTVAVTPNDDISSGTTTTRTIGSAFYTVDFLAGGHGIAFGKPASNVGFDCAMDATFEDTLTAQDMSAQEVQDFIDSLVPHQTVDGYVPYYKLLWTNPSPTSSFSAQTILTAQDIAGYDAFEIEVKNYYTGNIRNICKFSNNDPCWLWCFDTSALGTATGYRAIVNRRVTIDTNGLSVTTGYNKTSNSNSAGSTGDTLCIPLNIYGIKYR